MLPKVQSKAHQSRHQLNIILGNSFLNAKSALDADSGRLPSFQATSRLCQGAVNLSSTSAVCRGERNQETRENRKQLHHCTSAIRNRTSIPLNTTSKQLGKVPMWHFERVRLGLGVFLMQATALAGTYLMQSKQDALICSMRLAKFYMVGMKLQVSRPIPR